MQIVGELANYLASLYSQSSGMRSYGPSEGPHRIAILDLGLRITMGDLIDWQCHHDNCRESYCNKPVTHPRSWDIHGRSER